MVSGLEIEDWGVSINNQILRLMVKAMEVLDFEFAFGLKFWG